MRYLNIPDLKYFSRFLFILTGRIFILFTIVFLVITDSKRNSISCSSQVNKFNETKILINNTSQKQTLLALNHNITQINPKQTTPPEINKLKMRKKSLLHDKTMKLESLNLIRNQKSKEISSNLNLISNNNNNNNATTLTNNYDQINDNETDEFYLDLQINLNKNNMNASSSGSSSISRNSFKYIENELNAIINNQLKSTQTKSNSEFSDFPFINNINEHLDDDYQSSLETMTNATQPKLNKRINKVLLNVTSPNFFKHFILDKELRTTEAPTILDKTVQIFSDFKLYFLILISLVIVLIISIMLLIAVNFLLSQKYSKNYKRAKTMLRARKKNASFDIIDSGYRPSRNSFKLLTRPDSFCSNLARAHEYHFENFANLNRTYDKVEDSNENVYELPYIESIEFTNKTSKGDSSGTNFKTFSAKKSSSDKLKSSNSKAKNLNHQQLNEKLLDYSANYNNCEPVRSPSSFLNSFDANKRNMTVREMNLQKILRMEDELLNKVINI